MNTKIETIVNKYRNLILDAHDYIWTHPETGYREKQTSKYLEDAFEKMGYKERTKLFFLFYCNLLICLFYHLYVILNFLH